MIDTLLTTRTNQALPIIEARSRGERCCEPAAPRLSDAEVDSISADFDLLAHPIRVRLLDLLARQGGKVCVCDLEASVPVKQPTVSHHLKLLRRAGLISWEKRGLWSYYFINADAMRALRARIGDRLNAFS